MPPASGHGVCPNTPLGLSQTVAGRGHDGDDNNLDDGDDADADDGVSADVVNNSFE